MPLAQATVALVGLLLAAGPALADTDQYGRTVTCTGNAPVTCNSPGGPTIQAATIAQAIQSYNGMAFGSYTPPTSVPGTVSIDPTVSAAIAAAVATVAGTVPVSVSPAAMADGTLTTTLTTASGAQQVASTTTALNSINRLAYSPSSRSGDTTPYTITNGATIQLRDGAAVYMLAGSGLIAGATIRLPAGAQDGQPARLIFPAGITVTALTIQSGAGAAVTSLTSVVQTMRPVFQLQSVAWVQIGSA